MINSKKRLLALVLTLALVLGIVTPALAMGSIAVNGFAANGIAVTQGIQPANAPIVDPDRIIDLNAGTVYGGVATSGNGWEFNPAGTVLHITANENFRINGSGQTSNRIEVAPGVGANIILYNVNIVGDRSPLTLMAVGSTTNLWLEGNNQMHNYLTFGIDMGGDNLTINGTGTLNISGGISGISGGLGATLTIDGGTVEVSAGASDGIHVTTVQINNGTVNATGGSGVGFGIFGNTTISGDSTVVNLTRGINSAPTIIDNPTVTLINAPARIIIFNANSGTLGTASGTTDGSGRLATLPTPTRTGYNFDGWFTAAIAGTQITAGATGTVFFVSATIFAQWTALANPTVTWPTGLTATVGQTLSDISLVSFTNTGGTAGTFSWTNPAASVGAAGIRTHNITFTPTDTATYNTINSNVAMEVSATLTAPNFTTHPANQTTTVGGSATFTAAATGNPAPTFQWQYNDGTGWDDITGETTATLTLTSVTIAMSGYQYRVVATNTQGAVNSDFATLTVNPDPTPATIASIALQGAPAGTEIFGTGNTRLVTLPYGNDLADFTNAMLNITTDPAAATPSIAGEGTATRTITIPAGGTAPDNWLAMADSIVITVEIDAPLLGSANITSVTASTTNLPHSGGNSTITATGNNLVPGDIQIAAFLNNNGAALYQQTASGTASSVSAELTFPANTGTANRIYTIRISIDDGANWLATPVAMVTIAGTPTGGDGGGGGSDPTPEPTPTPQPTPEPPSQPTPQPSPTPTPEPPAEPTLYPILPSVRVELSQALTNELTELLGDAFYDLIINVETADNAENGFVTANIAFSLEDEALNGVLNYHLPNLLHNRTTYFTIIANLSDFVNATQNHYRITAIQNGAALGGNFDTATGYFTANVGSTGAFTIAYVQSLMRLNLQIGSPIIIDLANNAPTQFMDVLPLVQNGRTLIPVRFIAQAINADISRISSTPHSPAVIILTFNGQTLSFPIGELTPELQALGMDVPAQVIDGRTMVPLRFINEFFGAAVKWDSATQSIEIILAS